MPDESLSTLAPVDAVDVEAVKQQRGSLTRGPVAVTLLFLFGIAGLIGIGGFWAYPIWQVTEQTRLDISNGQAQIGILKTKLAEAKRHNTEAGPSEKEKVFSVQIPAIMDAPTLIRDLVRLVALNEVTPDDDLALKSFTMDAPKLQNDIAVTSVNATVVGPEESILALLSSANDLSIDDGTAGSSRRIVNVRGITISYAGNATTQGVKVSSASLRFSYLLRQESRHLLTESEKQELIEAKANRVERYQEARRVRDDLTAQLREIEGQNVTAGAGLLERADTLAKLRSDLKAQNDLVKSLQGDVVAASGNMSASVKLEFYAESAPGLVAPSATKPAAPPAAPATT